MIEEDQITKELKEIEAENKRKFLEAAKEATFSQVQAEFLYEKCKSNISLLDFT